MFPNSRSETESGGGEQAWREACGNAAPRGFEQGYRPVPWLHCLQEKAKVNSSMATTGGRPMTCILLVSYLYQEKYDVTAIVGHSKG
ncbi:unnamed protein product [Urochloa humidicola]